MMFLFKPPFSIKNSIYGFVARFPGWKVGRKENWSIDACMHACMHACMYVCMYACMYIYIMCTWVIWVSRSIPVYVHMMYICMCIYIYIIYIYICIYIVLYTTPRIISDISIMYQIIISTPGPRPNPDELLSRWVPIPFWWTEELLLLGWHDVSASDYHVGNSKFLRSLVPHFP